jgi:hypothetical protein
MDERPKRFPIAYSPKKGFLLTILLLPQRWSYVNVGADMVYASMGWAFQTKFARLDVEKTERLPDVKVTAGAHGWRGRWLVNGASGPIVAIKLRDPVRAFLLGMPITLRELRVSIEDPEGLMAALS